MVSDVGRSHFTFCPKEFLCWSLAPCPVFPTQHCLSLVRVPAVMFPLHGMNPEAVLGMAPIEDNVDQAPTEVGFWAGCRG